MASASNMKESGTTSSTLTVTIRKDDIANVIADVIVTSCSPTSFPQWSGFATSAALLNKGGDQLKTDCQQLASATKLEAGNVLQTPGYKLACKKVFHILLNTYNGSNDGDLTSAIQFCLKTAETKKFSRIAFPAIGSGGLKYPTELVARSFKHICNSFRGKYLKDVEIILYPKTEAVGVFAKVFHVTSLPVKIVAGHLIISHSRLQPKEKSKPTILLKQGDILKSSCQAIVNPSSKDFNLSGSNLSAKLLDNAGSSIAHQCRVRPLYESPTYRVTHGGNLNCNFVIHAVSSNDICRLAGTIHSVLTLAETKLKIKSLAIPAIGTGGAGLSSADAAHAMRQAFTNFERENPQNLQEIEVIVFEDEMLPDFKTEFSCLAMSKCYI